MKPATSSSSKTTPSPSASPPIKRKKVQSGTESQRKGCTLLLTGLAKSGKSSISNELTQMLKNSGNPVKQLDGKKMRGGLCKELDLGQPHHRSSFVHLVSEAAKLFTEEGFITIISIVAPLSQDREKARLSHQESNLAFLDVFVDRPKEECERLTGLLRNGLNIGAPIDANYEAPTSADLHLKPSGRSTASMCKEIVDTLIANNIIPQPHIPLMLPPPSPTSHMQPSPSPSSNYDASSTAEDDDDDEYDGNVSNVKFKLPQKKSALLAIFNYCKGEIIRRRKLQNNHAELKDEDVDKDPMFLIIMNEWKSHYETNVGEERFFPVLIPQPAKKKKATSTTTPKKGTKTPVKEKQDEFIPFYWDGETIKFGKIGPKQAFPPQTKCRHCWQDTRHCKTIGTSNLHFAVLQDNHASVTTVMMQQQLRNKQEWTNDLVRKIGTSSNMTLLLKYLDTHPNTLFTEKYAKSLTTSSLERLPIIHTVKLSTALICLVRNLKRLEDVTLIQPHELLQSRIDMKSANLDVIERTLNENGITFTVSDDETQPPLMNEDVFSWGLPYVYCGNEPDSTISIGLKVATGGSVGSDYTHSDAFSAGILYQTPLTPTQVEIADFVAPTTPRDTWTSQQVTLVDAKPALREKVAADCKRKEALGITALLIAQMKGESRDGISIIRNNQHYEHINTAEEGDLLYIQQVFKFLTGRALSISTTNSNDLSFNDEFIN